jgi:pimeloyl-ACP methyl ester carboxylesterase
MQKFLITLLGERDMTHLHFHYSRSKNPSIAHRRCYVSSVALLFALCLTLLGTSAAAHGAGHGPGNGNGSVPPWADGEGFEQVVDPATTYFAQLGLLDWVDNPSASPGIDLDAFHTLDHLIPLPEGGHIHALETFTLDAWLKPTSRGVLLLNGSAFVANHWSITADGYNGAQILADEDYFAFAVDFLGTGESYRPAHGSDAEYEDNREAMKTVLRYIRYFRDVRKVDIIGAGYGGAMGMELAADRHRVRSVSTSAMIYKQVQGGPLTNPGFVAFLQSIPNAYAFLEGRGSLIFMAEAPQAAQDFVVVTQGGFYPVDNFLVAADRPFFDPSVGKAPALILFGGLDFIAVREDIEELAADYGSHGAKLVIDENAGHAPRAGSPTEAAWYWQETLAFLDNPNAGN